MSRSNPQDEVQINPCTKWFTWDGDTGKGLKQYNKETKKNEIVSLPFRFLVLDRLTTVTGFNEPQQVGYYSNEVRNIKDKLVVRSKNGIEAEGTWEEIKAKLGVSGADFAQSVYIAYFEGKVLTLGNIKMKGAALGNWFEFCKTNKVMEIGVTITGAKESKKGKIVYFEPLFAPMTIKDETNKAAVDIDVELQAYLKGYLERNQTTVEQPKNETSVETGQSQNTSRTEVKEEKKSADDSNNEFQSTPNPFTDDNEDLPF